MKRQRGNSRKGTKTRSTIKKVVTKKKDKGPAAKAKEVAAERKEAADEKGILSAEEMAEWTSLWSGVADEEMSWATNWIPFWEMEATGEGYDALYGDVLWDYDIWDLKATKNIASNP